MLSTRGYSSADIVPAGSGVTRTSTWCVVSLLSPPVRQSLLKLVELLKALVPPLTCVTTARQVHRRLVA
jgi:hypothetical protein